ncbi:MAG: Inner membrane protein YabI [bacterium ADurb.Bin400]|nr:MAG: Inner membrane protein YabI [bacterium ADurb.Bin400]
MFADLIVAFASLITGTIDYFGYAGIFVLMLVESAGILIPSEIIMPFAGFVVSEGRIGFWMVVVMGASGNLVGSLLAYWIGYRGGRPLIEKYGRYVMISKHDLDLADRWFTKYGIFTTFFGRVLPIVRTYISFPAGIARMNLWKFSIYTFLGALPWCAALTYAGVRLGSNWEVLRERLHGFDTAVGILLVVFSAGFVWRHVRRAKASGSSRNN